jgi:hypothetical protein
MHGPTCIFWANLTPFSLETLPKEQRVPFRWKGSNPLSFLVLFRRGAKLRLLALAQIWNSVSGRFSTYRYEELHMQQTLQWGLAAGLLTQGSQDPLALR